MFNRLESKERLLQRPIKRVSVCIPALNEGRNISRLYEDIKTQQFPEGVELKVIFSDNGSTDRTSASEYQRLLAKYPTDLKVVQGSKRGYLGAAREYGVKAAVDWYNQDHSGMSQSHIILGIDADARFDTDVDLFTNLVRCFKENPEAALAYGPLPLATEKGKLFASSFLADAMLRGPEFRSHFARNERKGMIDEFLHKPKRLFYGGFEVFTQEAYKKVVEQFGSLYNMSDSTAEDITFSLRTQHIFPHEQTIYDRGLQLPFSLRQVQKEDGSLDLRKALKEGMKFITSGREHLPHKLATLLESMPPAEREIFIRDLGNLSYRGAVNTFIRSLEEAMFNLNQYEHILEYVNNKKAKRLETAGYDIREGISSVTGHTLYAVVAHASEKLDLDPHEYVAFYANKKKAIKLNTREYAKIIPLTKAYDELTYAIIGQKASSENVNYAVIS